MRKRLSDGIGGIHGGLAVVMLVLGATTALADVRIGWQVKRGDAYSVRWKTRLRTTGVVPASGRRSVKMRWRCTDVNEQGALFAVELERVDWYFRRGEFWAKLDFRRGRPTRGSGSKPLNRFASVFFKAPSLKLMKRNVAQEYLIRISPAGKVTIGVRDRRSGRMVWSGRSNLLSACMLHPTLTDAARKPGASWDVSFDEMAPWFRQASSRAPGIVPGEKTAWLKLTAASSRSMRLTGTATADQLRGPYRDTTRVDLTLDFSSAGYLRSNRVRTTSRTWAGSRVRASMTFTQALSLEPLRPAGSRRLGGRD